MEVLTLCGSLRPVSANGAALAVVEAALAVAGVSWRRFDDLAGVAPFDPGLTDDAPEATQRWLDQVDQATGVALAAPEYAGSLAGVAKNALDWLVGTAGLYEKPVLIVSAGTTGGRYAREELLRTLTWQGAFVVAEVGVSAEGLKADAEGRLTDPDTVSAIRTAAGELVAALGEPSERRAERREAVQARLSRGLGGV
ncbi:MAG: NADPH-dependent FMN reductase [Acidimicrobiales bacterium]